MEFLDEIKKETLGDILKNLEEYLVILFLESSPNYEEINIWIEKNFNTEKSKHLENNLKRLYEIIKKKNEELENEKSNENTK